MSAAVKIGDRVLVDVTMVGETFPTEVVVVQVDEDGSRGTRIIGRPEETLVMAFARYEWCALDAVTAG